MKSKSKWAAKVFPAQDDTVDQMALKDSTTFFPQSSPPPAHSSNSSPEPISPIFGAFAVREDWKQRPKELLSSWPYAIVSMTMVIFTLLGDPLRVVVCSKDTDYIFSAVYTIVLFLFMSEWGVSLVLREEYRGAIPCWLDCSAALCLLADISWVAEPLFGSPLPWNWTRRAVRFTGYSARIASKTLKFIKWRRLMKVVKAAKWNQGVRGLSGLKSESAVQGQVDLINQQDSFARKIRGVAGRNAQRDKQQAHISPAPLVLSPPNTTPQRGRTFKQLFSTRKGKRARKELGYVEIPVESNMSKVILGRAVVYVLGLVLLSALFQPFFLDTNFTQPAESQQFHLDLISDLRNKDSFQLFISDYVVRNQQADRYKLLLLTDSELILWDSGISYESYRPWETRIFAAGSLKAVFDIKAETRLLAGFDMLQVLFLSSLLSLTCLFVARDYTRIVLTGIERMISFTKRIARNPLLLLSQPSLPSLPSSTCCWPQKNAQYGSIELELVETAMRKIGVLLALGLGTAGCEVITRNMQGTAGLDPVIPGQKIFAVFAFISLREFSALEDLLNSKLLIYVNKLSRIVHCQVEKYQGAINKNLGDSFLAVWKFEQDDGLAAGSRVIINPYSLSVRLKSALALLTSIKVVAKVARSSPIANYLNGAGMKDIEGFLSTQLSVGLHVGWAFEGPVGSAFKIDTTYISPHVNKTARIESISREYNVRILTSDDFLLRLDDEIKLYMRHVDTVILKGTAEPVRLYTFDLDPTELLMSAHTANPTEVVVKRAMVKQAFAGSYFTVHELFTKSQKITLMRSAFTSEFVRIHQLAVNHYIEGRWKQARDAFYQCLDRLPKDGPTLAILLYMEQLNFQCPVDWIGVRLLSTK